MSVDDFPERVGFANAYMNGWREFSHRPALTARDIIRAANHLSVLRMLRSPYMTQKTRVALIRLWRRDRGKS